VVTIHLPPLRDRREDVPLLARHFIERTAHELGREVGDISDEALALLLEHDWPGNVRELENAIERAMITCKTPVLTEQDFGFLVQMRRDRSSWAVPPSMTLDELEKRAIAATLERTGGNIKESAAILGIDRSTLYDRIKRYNLPR
jgi:DNA-binding NtrC family response regulator